MEWGRGRVKICCICDMWFGLEGVCLFLEGDENFFVREKKFLCNFFLWMLGDVSVN